MYGQTIGKAITNNDFGTLRQLLNQHYYNTNIPTMTEKMVENAKLMCIYSGKEHLLDAFKKYPKWVPSQ